MTGALPYRYGLLLPVRHPRADEHNAALLGNLTLGIEVTEKELALACCLGNIDPQHEVGGKSALAASPEAAIEAALKAPLPPVGALLVTIRPDADAFGAMAVLTHRAQRGRIDRTMQARIAEIARLDAFRMGNWTDWRRDNPPLPAIAGLDHLAPSGGTGARVTRLSMDSSLTSSQRVRSILGWLVSGYLQTGATCGNHFEQQLVRSWNARKTTVETVHHNIAVVRSDHAGALRTIGYRHAPVVIAEGCTDTGRKVTVAQFESGWIDLAGLRDRLNMIEPGWGGSPTIVGSPQGTPCRVRLEYVTCAAIDLLRGQFEFEAEHAEAREHGYLGGSILDGRGQ